VLQCLGPCGPVLKCRTGERSIAERARGCVSREPLLRYPRSDLIVGEGHRFAPLCPVKLYFYGVKLYFYGVKHYFTGVLPPYVQRKRTQRSTIQSMQRLLIPIIPVNGRTQGPPLQLYLLKCWDIGARGPCPSFIYKISCADFPPNPNTPPHFCPKPTFRTSDSSEARLHGAKHRTSRDVVGRLGGWEKGVLVFGV